MDFKDRLQRASDRGQQRRDDKLAVKAAKEISEEECRRLHSSYRHTLTEVIEDRLQQLVDSFPGFRFETVVSEKGWGAAVARDDLSLEAGKRANLFSRLELLISPHNQYHVLELLAKGTVRNKENFTRSHYQLLRDADLDSFEQFIEQWTLDYAELFSAEGA